MPSPTSAAPSATTAGMERVLQDVHVDPEKVNVAALRGVSVPTPLAVSVAKDALRAAQQYYELFFDTKTEEDSTPHDVAGTEAAARHSNNGSGSSSCSSSSSQGSESDEESEEEEDKALGLDCNCPAATPLYGKLAKPTRSKGRRHHHHHSTPHKHLESLASPVNVHNTNYHTFFPPPLSHRQRKHIVHRIIGKHRARPFSQWSWHKAEEYHVLHARTVAQHQSSASLDRQPLLSILPVAASGTPAAVKRGGDQLSLTYTEATEFRPPVTDGAAATSSNAAPAAAAGTATTTAAAHKNASTAVHRDLGSTPSSVPLHHAMNRPGAFSGGYQVSPTAPNARITAFPVTGPTVAATATTPPPPPTGGAAAAAAGATSRPTSTYARGGLDMGGVGEVYRSILSHSSSSRALSANTTATPTPTPGAAEGAEGGVRGVNGTADPLTQGEEHLTAGTTARGEPDAPHDAEVTEVENTSMASAASAPALGTRAVLESAPQHRSSRVAGAASGTRAGAAATTAAASPVLSVIPGGASPLTSSTTLHFDEENAMYTIPASQLGPEYFAQTAEDGTKTLVIVMVGLPARGKTFLAQKIARLLGWHGTKAKVQNIQVAWRRALLDWEASRRKVDALREAYQQDQLAKAGGKESVEHQRQENHHADPADQYKPSEMEGGEGNTAAEEEEMEARSMPIPQASTDVIAESVVEAETAAACPSVAAYNEPSPRDTPAATETTSKASSPNTASSSAIPAPTSSASTSESKVDPTKAPYLRMENFANLIQDPNSIERRLYRQVLRGFAADCRLFFASGGEVIIINDDFITEDLRDEAEQLFKPLAANFVFMEVMRDAEQNKRFNACKVKDPTEYPRDRISLREAKKDFDGRLELLERLYEPLADAKDPASTDEGRLDDRIPGSDDDGDSAQAAGRAAGGSPQSPSSPHNAPGQPNVAAGGTTAIPGKRKKRTHPTVRSYIKIRNSDMIETHGIKGYLASRIISYVMNLSQVKIQHPIYFVRHGESCYNLEDRIGGNPLLTGQGMRDAAALLEFMDSLKSHLEHIDRQQQHRQRLLHEEQTRRWQQQQQQQQPERRDGAPGQDGSPLCDGVGARQMSSGPESVGALSSSSPFLSPGTGDASHGRSSPDPSTAAATSFAGANCATGDGKAFHGSSTNGGSAPPPPPPPPTLFSPHTHLDNSSANNLEIWTSQLRRAIQTAELSERLLNIKTLRWSSLNEIHAGICEDMTYAEVKKEYPLIEKFRKQSKYTFRYPEGESYQDLVVRLEPVIMELENADKVVVVVAHQAVLRCLLAYFGSTSAESSIRVEVPHRTVWRCTYDSKGIASLEELKLDNWEAGFAPLKKSVAAEAASSSAHAVEDAETVETARHLASIVREADGI